MKLFFKIIFLFFVFISQLFLVFSQDEFILNSPNYFEEQNNVYENINYLENEILSFEICSSKNSKNFNAKIICGEDSYNLDLFEKLGKETEVCFFSNIRMEEIYCDNFALEVSYQDNNLVKKIDRNFKLQKESLLLNHILNTDINQLSPLDLSYYLVTLNSVGLNGFLNEQAYEKLKNLRNNENKCWPSNSCDLELTSEILKNLKIANYGLESRLLQDGRIYLEKNLIKNHQINFDFETDQNNLKEFFVQVEHNFSLGQEIFCELEIDNGVEVRNYILDENSKYNDLLIKRSARDNIKFSCDNNLDKVSFFIFDREIYAQYLQNRNNIGYVLNSLDKENFDNFQLRLFLEEEILNTEEITCDLEIDGVLDEIIFNSDSIKNDFLIVSDIEEDFSLNCDNSFNKLYLNIVAGEVIEETFSQNSEFEYVLSSTRDDSFKFNLFLDYNFIGNEVLVCDLKIDLDNQKTYNFKQGDLLEISNQFLGSELEFICNKNLGELSLEIFDKFNRKQVNEIKYNIDKLNYKLPSFFSEYSCIGNENNCNFYASLNAITIYDKNFEDYEKLESFVDSFILYSNNLAQIDNLYPIEDSGKYLFYKKNDLVKNFLKFRQNNQGSWGDGNLNEKLEPTAYSLIGLTKHEEKSEYIGDGKKWIYFNEPTSGWDSYKKNSLAFLAIKEQLKPYLKLNIENEIEKYVDFQIENPTIYNLMGLEVSFSENLNPNLEYIKNLGNLGSEEKINFTLKVDSNFKGNEFGYFKISGINNEDKRIELLKLPILIKGPLPISFNEDKFYFTSDLGVVIIEYDSEFNFNEMKCIYENPFSLFEEEIILNSKENKIFMMNPELKTGNFNLNLNCVLEENSFEISHNFDLDLINKTFDLDVIGNTYYITSLDDFSINLISDSKDRQIISFDISGEIADFVKAVEEQKIIAGNDERSLFFTIEDEILFEALGNSTSGEITIYSDSGYFKTIALKVDLNSNTDENSFFSFWMIVVFICLAFFLLVLYRLIELRKYHNEEVEFHEDEDFYFDEDELNK